MQHNNYLILCRPLLLLPSVFPSRRVFSNGLALQFRWPKYWNFSFNISSSNEYSELISFRIDWCDLLEVPRDSQESSWDCAPREGIKVHLSSLYSVSYSCCAIRSLTWISLAKIQVFGELCFLLKALGDNVSLPFPPCWGHLHSLAYGPFLHLKASNRGTHPSHVLSLWLSSSL